MTNPVSLPNLPLPNIRWERFAHALADGENQMQAYITAGYSPNRGQSSRLAHESAVVRRVAYLLQIKGEVIAEAVAEATKAVAITKAMVLAELWDNAQKAKAAIPVFDKKGAPTGEYTANWTASNQALHLLGKELGMFRGPIPEDEEQDASAGRTGLDEEAVGKIKQKILDITS